MECDAIAEFCSAPKHQRVLLVSYGGGHILKIVPVVEVLRSEGVHCLVMALTIGYPKALQLGLRPVGYKDFLYLVDQSRVLSIGEELLTHNSHPDVDVFESICYLGINYLEMVGEFGVKLARERFDRDGRYGFFPLKFFLSILTDLQPSAVVATSSPRSEHAAIEAAIIKGIPSLTMVDFIPPSDLFMQRKRHADRVTVSAPFVAKSLIDSGVSASKIVVTGSPDLDALFSPTIAHVASEIRSSLGWNGLRVILWAGYKEPPNDSGDPSLVGVGLGVRVERYLRAWILDHVDFALVIRYHPGQYHEFPDLGPQSRVYCSNPIADPLAPFLHLAEAVVVQASTVGFEAATLGRHVVTLGFSPSVRNSDFDYEKFGLGVVANDLDELGAYLTDLHSEAAVTKLADDGLASRRVANEILHLLSHSD